MNGANGVDGDRSVVGKTNAERQAQMLYWTEHSVETTVEAMMLDSQAKAIDLEERPEVSIVLRVRHGHSGHQNGRIGTWRSTLQNCCQLHETLLGPSGGLLRGPFSA